MENNKTQEIMLQLLHEVKGIKEDIGGLKKDMVGVKEDIANIKEDISNMKKDMNDRFDVIDIQIHTTQKYVLMNKESNKRLQEQMTSTMEDVEKLKLKH